MLHIQHFRVFIGVKSAKGYRKGTANTQQSLSKKEPRASKEPKASDKPSSDQEEIDTTPSSPTLMTSARVPTGGRRGICHGQLLPTRASHDKKDERIKVAGVVTQLNYSSEDVDEEREMEAPPGYRSQPPGGTRGKEWRVYRRF
ncbi:hypothetical protein Tco_0004616 [Tanacetum coccineum]